MKRASYRKAIQFIAYNDSPGDSEAFDFFQVRGYASVLSISEIFGVAVSRVAVDVVTTRLKWAAEDEDMRMHLAQTLERHDYQDAEQVEALRKQFEKLWRKARKLD